MTEELYERMLEDTKQNDGYYKLKQTNIDYAALYPETEFTLVRRISPSVKVGFSTIIMPSFHINKYFSSIPARMEGVTYLNIGTLDEIQAEFRAWLQERL